MKELDPRIHKLAWIFLNGIGPQRSRQLLSCLKNPSEVFLLEPEVLCKLTGISLKILQKVKREQAVEEAKKLIPKLDKYNTEMTFIKDENYPERLKQCVDAPLVLFYKGDINFLRYRFVSVVGMRNASSYGRKVVEEFIDACVGQNIVIVSGLAYGIDIAAHRRCLLRGVPTMSVFGHGFDIIYPGEHRGDAQKILEHGAWISEFPPGTKLDPGNFPMRNRIVAGLCDAVLVVESKEKGGSLITADLALDYNREVMAVPGPINHERSAGCNKFIASNKAQLYTGPKDFFKWMGWDKPEREPDLFTSHIPLPDLPIEQLQVMELLLAEGQLHADVISAKMKCSVSKSSVLLFQLETAGLVKSLPGNMYGAVQ